MNISDFIKAKRLELGLTQPVFAQKAGVGLRFLRELERGKPTLRLDKVNQVLQLFGVEVGVVKAVIARQETAVVLAVAEETSSKSRTQTSVARASQSSKLLQIAASAARPNVLVLCGRNKKRSRTAEQLFKGDNRFYIRSAGVSPRSDRKVTEKDLQWADLVLVMEHKHRGKLQSQFPGLALPLLEVLHIVDEYSFMDSALVTLLTTKINARLKAHFQL